MKNKKAMGIFGIISTAAIAMIILWIFVGPIIKDIIVDKQIAHAGGQTEAVTKDCDGDGVIGFSDQCPCNADESKLDKGKTCPTEIKPASAETNCPALCKK